VAHVGEEGCLGLVGLLGRVESVSQSLLGLKLVPRLFIDVREAGADLAHRMAFFFFFVFFFYAGKLDGLPGLLAVNFYHVAVRDDLMILQGLSDMIYLYELKEWLSVLLQNVVVAVCFDSFEIAELITLPESRQVGTGLIANALVFVEVDVVNAPVVR